MIYDVEQKLAEIIENASIPGVNSVLAGSRNLIATVKYPVVIVDIISYLPTGSRHQMNWEILGVIKAISMQPRITEGFGDGVVSAFEELSKILFDLTTKNGITSIFINNPSFTIDGIKFNVITKEQGIIKEGVDSAGRAVMGIEIPITIITKISLT